MKRLLTLILLAGLFACKEDVVVPETPKVSDANTFDTPYVVDILDEHKVMCHNAKDTVLLYFENAFALHEERIVYIKK